eukprot:CAMPEP_0119150298 /NCGR_PEP_ID=MMETSP1310-20130426/44596_1 /TAXON_ID=464262 /ORGANISM="Genus nov. species nov., Strain RCC2339" /LENGTH=200 /DNA_ID=CAMNT_0007142477 /DNA_START=92 /DNA_END=690 /DNA_ORIENTATION=-
MNRLRQKWSTVVDGSPGGGRTDSVDADHARLEESRAFLKDIVRIGGKYGKTVEDELVEGHSLTGALREYSNALNAKALDPTLADTLGLAAEVLEYVLQQQRVLKAQVESCLVEPIRRFLAEDLKEGRSVKRNYDQARADHEGINAKVRESAGKGNVDLRRTMELQREQEICRDVYQRTLAMAMESMRQLLLKNQAMGVRG